MPDKQSDQKVIHVLIADDHEIVRQGLETILATQPDMAVVGAAADGVAAVSLARQIHPDVILMDLVMPRQDGVAAIAAVTQDVPRARILVLTSFADDERVFPAIKAGALGYLLKDTPRDQLCQAIRDVAAGHVFLDTRIALKLMHELKTPSDLPHTTNPLTAREMETLRGIARGLSNQEIAAELGIHERTVAKYVSTILDKLHLANRTQAALYAMQQGLADQA
jgi:NarL family two-component system response regulator LiaR